MQQVQFGRWCVNHWLPGHETQAYHRLSIKSLVKKNLARPKGRSGRDKQQRKSVAEGTAANFAQLVQKGSAKAACTRDSTLSEMDLTPVTLFWASDAAESERSGNIQIEYSLPLQLAIGHRRPLLRTVTGATCWVDEKSLLNQSCALGLCNLVVVETMLSSSS